MQRVTTISRNVIPVFFVRSFPFVLVLASIIVGLSGCTAGMGNLIGQQLAYGLGGNARDAAIFGVIGALLGADSQAGEKEQQIQEEQRRFNEALAQRQRESEERLKLEQERMNRELELEREKLIEQKRQFDETLKGQQITYTKAKRDLSLIAKGWIIPVNQIGRDNLDIPLIGIKLYEFPNDGGFSRSKFRYDDTILAVNDKTYSGDPTDDRTKESFRNWWAIKLNECKEAGECTITFFANIRWQKSAFEVSLKML